MIARRTSNLLRWLSVAAVAAMLAGCAAQGAMSSAGADGAMHGGAKPVSVSNGATANNNDQSASEEAPAPIKRDHGRGR